MVKGGGLYQSRAILPSFTRIHALVSSSGMFYSLVTPLWVLRSAPVPVGWPRYPALSSTSGAFIVGIARSEECVVGLCLSRHSFVLVLFRYFLVSTRLRSYKTPLPWLCVFTGLYGSGSKGYPLRRWLGSCVLFLCALLGTSTPLFIGEAQNYRICLCPRNGLSARLGVILVWWGMRLGIWGVVDWYRTHLSRGRVWV